MYIYIYTYKNLSKFPNLLLSLGKSQADEVPFFPEPWTKPKDFW